MEAKPEKIEGQSSINELLDDPVGTLPIQMVLPIPGCPRPVPRKPRTPPRKIGP